MVNLLETKINMKLSKLKNTPTIHGNNCTVYKDKQILGMSLYITMSSSVILVPICLHGLKKSRAIPSTSFFWIKNARVYFALITLVILEDSTMWLAICQHEFMNHIGETLNKCTPLSEGKNVLCCRLSWDMKSNM